MCGNIHSTAEVTDGWMMMSLKTDVHEKEFGGGGGGGSVCCLSLFSASH